MSGLGWGGPPGAVLDAALAGQFDVVTSPELLEELRRVLAYPKLEPMVGPATELVELFALAAIVAVPTERVDVVRDPDDNRLIEAALAGDADVIVSGDEDLLSLRRVDRITIMSAREFLDTRLSEI